MYIENHKRYYYKAKHCKKLIYFLFFLSLLFHMIRKSYKILHTYMEKYYFHWKEWDVFHFIYSFIHIFIQYYLPIVFKLVNQCLHTYDLHFKKIVSKKMLLQSEFNSSGEKMILKICILRNLLIHFIEPYHSYGRTLDIMYTIC